MSLPATDRRNEPDHAAWENIPGAGVQWLAVPGGTLYRPAGNLQLATQPAMTFAPTPSNVPNPVGGTGDTATILAAIQTLRTEITTMSATLADQETANAAAIASDLQGIAASLGTLATNIATLTSQLTPGTQITQAAADGLAALKTQADAVAATASSMVAPAPVAAPAA